MAEKQGRTAKVTLILDDKGALARAYATVHFVYVEGEDVLDTLPPQDVELTGEEVSKLIGVAASLSEQQLAEMSAKLDAAQAAEAAAVDANARVVFDARKVGDDREALRQRINVAINALTG